MFKIEPQPAIKSYFFGKGFKDLVRMIKDFWALNKESARKNWQKAGKYWEMGGLKSLYCVPGAFASVYVYLFGSIWVFVLSLIHVIILALFFVLVYISYSFLWLVERLYMLMRGIFTACPNCHSRSLLPHYLCPRCKVVHTRLVPSSYGILHRTCLCGQKLPTTFFQRRHQLKDQARCPREDCGKLLGTREAAPICIPLIGGPSVGKTCYLFAATMALIRDLAPHHSWRVTFLGSYSETMYNKISQQFQKGVRPDKTMERNPPAFNLFLENKHWSVEKLLYLYDAAGEAFGSVDYLVSHRFYGFLHGFLFIIDPFSIPALLDQYKDEMALHGAEIRPSSMNMERTYTTMLTNLETNHKIKAATQITKPCAIVINKVDAFDLEDRIGAVAARRLMMANPGIGSMSEAIDRLCRDFLKDLGLGDFLAHVDHKFKENRFFSVSALGRTADGDERPFTPVRVLEPLEWILTKSDKDIGKEYESLAGPEKKAKEGR